MRLNDRDGFEGLLDRNQEDSLRSGSDLELAKTFSRRDMNYTPCLSRLNHESGYLKYSLKLAGTPFFTVIQLN